MASLIIKLVYILIGLSIAEDFLHSGGFRFNAEQYGTEISAQSSGLFLPGANGVPVWPLVRRPLVRRPLVRRPLIDIISRPKYPKNMGDAGM